MPRVQAIFIALGTAIVVFMLAANPAAGHGKKHRHKTKQRIEKDREEEGHSHGGGHDHGKKKGDHGHGHSAFSFNVGASISQTLASPEEAEEEGEEETETGAALRRSKGYSLGEGHDHGGGGESGGGGGGGGGSTTLEPQFSVAMGYRLPKKFSMNLGLGFAPTAGIGDPSLGIAYAGSLSRRVTTTTSLSATAPVSKASQEKFKMTTITAAYRANWRKGKWSIGGGPSISSSWYSKTVITEEEPHEEDEDHDHALTSIRPNGLSLHGGDGGDHGAGSGGAVEIGGETEGAGDREFNRYGGSANLAYKIAKKLSLGTGGGVAMVTHQFGPATYETLANIIQATYGMGSVALALSLDAIASAPSVAVPDTSSVTLGLSYSFE